MYYMRFMYSHVSQIFELPWDPVLRTAIGDRNYFPLYFLEFLS